MSKNFAAAVTFVVTYGLENREVQDDLKTLPVSSKNSPKASRKKLGGGFYSKTKVALFASVIVDTVGSLFLPTHNRPIGDP